MSDVETIIREVFDEAARERLGMWLGRYGRDGLATRIDRAWRSRFPDRRNRPQHRTIETALQRLLDDGTIEHKTGEFDELYRKLPS